MIYKGIHSFIESYSSFYDNRKLSETKLKTELLRRGVTDIFIGGLATDVCVGKGLASLLLSFFGSVPALSCRFLETRVRCRQQLIYWFLFQTFQLLRPSMDWN